MDTIPGPREYVGMLLVNLARKRKQAKAVSSTGVSTFIRIVLHLAGFALLTIAAFQFNIIAGYAVAGISCFVLSTLLSGGTDNGGASDPRMGR